MLIEPPSMNEIDFSMARLGFLPPLAREVPHLRIRDTYLISETAPA